MSTNEAAEDVRVALSDLIETLTAPNPRHALQVGIEAILYRFEIALGVERSAGAAPLDVRPDALAEAMIEEGIRMYAGPDR